MTGEGFTLELTRDEGRRRLRAGSCLLCPSPCPRCGGGPRCDCAFGGNLLCRPGPEQPPFVKAGDRVKKGRNAVSHRGDEK